MYHVTGYVIPSRALTNDRHSSCLALAAAAGGFYHDFGTGKVDSLYRMHGNFCGYPQMLDEM